MNGADHVFDIDPAHPLMAIADSATQAQLERCQHRAEGSTFAAEHYARANLYGADASFDRGLGGCLPIAAKVGKKIRASRAALAQDFVASVSVVSNCRAAHEDLRLDFCLRQRLGQVAS